MGFVRRGLVSCGFGPLVLAVCYLVLQRQGVAETIALDKVCLGIVSISALAFIAGGLNVVYQIERIPLMVAIFIHGSILYASYLVTYLLNDWLEWGVIPVCVFTGIFVLGYLTIWAIIYSVIRKNTKKINEALEEKRQKTEGVF